MNAERLLLAVIRDGIDSPAARVAMDILDAAKAAADASAMLADPLPEEMSSSALIPIFPEFSDLADAVGRAWVVA